MKKNKIFIACDSKNILKIKEIIKKSKTSKLKIGYKFGLEFSRLTHRKLEYQEILKLVRKLILLKKKQFTLKCQKTCLKK